MRGRTSPVVRAALAGAGALALLALVGLASRGGLGGGGGATTGTPSHTLMSYALSIFVVVYLVTAPFALWAFVVRRREESVRRQQQGGRVVRVIVNALVLLAFVGAALGIERLRHADGRPPLGKASKTLTRIAPPKGKRLRPAPPEPSFRWPVAAVAAAIAAAALAAYLATRRRKAAPRRPGAAAELALALDDAIDDVLAESDPRRAVIKAYARMEAVLGAHGLPRREAEAPYEYLSRALRELDASAGSLARLTELFERARFSLHEIDASMRGDAIDALTAVRAEVAAA